jgi:hypothetical protein
VNIYPEGLIDGHVKDRLMSWEADQWRQ